jgi:hypothetical protein
MGTCIANTIPCVGAPDGQRDEARRGPATRLIYNAEDPFAIGLELADKRRQLLWSVSRALLYLGVDDPATTSIGHGDIRISVEGDEVRLELSNPNGRFVLWLPADEVREFLAVTFDEIPLGTEADHIDWAATTQLLLGRHPAG